MAKRTSRATASQAAQPEAPAKTSTQQRVLDVSIELFNHYGIDAVSIQQISEALKISPGNLTYHYKKKSDLAAEHLSIFEDQLNDAVRHYPSSHDPHAQVMAFGALLRLSLRYRFLFVGANFILQNELIPASRYAELIAHTKRNFTAQIRRLNAAGVLRRVTPPHTSRRLVDLIWTQWLGALLDAQIRPAESRPSEEQLIVEIAILILFVIQPYTEKPFFDGVYEELHGMQRKLQKK